MVSQRAQFLSGFASSLTNPRTTLLLKVDRTTTDRMIGDFFKLMTTTGALVLDKPPSTTTAKFLATTSSTVTSLMIVTVLSLFTNVMVLTLGTAGKRAARARTLPVTSA